jgi:protoporphyrinogen/coproporphyrinogen III oxidase
VTTAIVGGGLAGLAAGYDLARRGTQVVVFEALDRLGGRAMTDELDGVSVDPGAQLFGSMYDRFLRLVREVGLGSRLVRVPGRDALWRDGRAHEVVYGSVPSMVASGGLPFRTKMRLGAKYVPFLTRHSAALDLHAPERAAEDGLDGESIADWGAREIDANFVDYLVYPQLGAFYGSTPEETSAGFYHILGRHGLDIALYAVNGGVGQVASRLADRIREAGGEIRAGMSVQALELRSDGVAVVSGGATEEFDAAVAALPVPDLLGILAGAPPRLLEWLRSVRYRPTLSLALLLHRRREARYFGLSFPRGSTRYLAVVSLQENKGVPFEHPGGVMVAFPTPEAAPDLIDLPSRDVLDRLLPEISAVFPDIERDVTRARVYRWPTGTPLFYPGYLGRLAILRSGEVEGGARIALAGDYLYGPTVEGAVTSGFVAAERVRKLSNRG